MGATPLQPSHRRGGLMFPVLLILLGVMFLLDQFVPGWGVGKTWPVLLVVIGVLKLLDTTRPPRPPEGPRI
jgi:membrane-bound ClpP family serine protease